MSKISEPKSFWIHDRESYTVGRPDERRNTLCVCLHHNKARDSRDFLLLTGYRLLKMGRIILSLWTVSTLAALANCQEFTEAQFECDDENIKCYSLIRATTTWEQAIDTCSSMGRHLAIINNLCSQRLLEKLIPMTDSDIGHAWVALRRSDDRSWRYSTGELFSHHVISQDSQAYCAVLDVDVNEFRPVNFRARRCYEDVPRKAICQFPSTPDDCALGFYTDGTCYRQTTLSFWSQVDASQYCVQYHDNGTLAHERLTESRLNHHFWQRGKEWYWVGVERRSWTWYRDGTAQPVTYSRWRFNEGTGQHEECMHLELKLQSSWADKSCALQSDYVVCETGPGPQRTPFSYSDIFQGDFWPSGFFATFYQGDTYVYRDTRGDVVATNALTEQTDVIMPDGYLSQLNAWTQFVSPDLQFVLIGYERKRLYRESFIAKYKIFDRANSRLLDFPNVLNLRNQPLQYAQWSQGNNHLVFVAGNDLYYQANPVATARRLTTDGLDKFVFNGVPDWMFEEDILWSNKATYWSRTGARLCFAKFDLRGIPLMKIPIYGEEDNMYPEVWEIAIPKAGYLVNGRLGATTRVELYVFDTFSPSDTPRKLPPPSELAGQDHYYTSVHWVDDVTVYVTWTNRAMNKSITSFCNTNSMSCVTNHELVEAGGWVYIPAVAPIFTDSKDAYLTILPREIPGSGSWRHLAVVSIDGGLGDVRFLTDGPQEITDLLGYDSFSEYVYYRTTDGDPTQRHIFRVLLSGTSPECLTCDLGPECRYAAGTFSVSARYYILNCRGPGVPTYRLKATDGSKDISLENNTFIRFKLEEKRLPRRDFIDVPLGGGLSAKAEVYFPPNYIPGRKYNMLHYVYGAPDSQEVVRIHPFGTYRTAWFNYLCSSKNVIITVSDGRGTLGRGDTYRFGVYGQMGRLDVSDQLTVARYLKGMHYVNGSANAAVIGWSYGGLLASIALADDPDMFQCGLAISPVISKRYYDRAYSERHFGFANESIEAYDGADMVRRAPLLEGKKYFIAHGTKDDNVHYMHSAQLMKALTRNRIQFEQTSYIDENHDLSSYTTTQHLYQAMTDFLLDNCWR